MILDDIKRGSFKHQEANEWIKECLRRGNEKHRIPVVLVIDNAPCHSRVEEILLEDEFSRNRILRLAPYSPMLNPIEHVWSKVKSIVKSDLALKMPDILANETKSNLSIRNIGFENLKIL